MDFRPSDLPYADSALLPWLSPEAVRHHREIELAGLEQLEQELAGSVAEAQSLESVVLGSSGRMFNLAAQVYCHDCYWQSLRPGGGGAPPDGEVGRMIAQSFGSWEACREGILAAGRDRFASGFVWLVLEDDRLEILPTPNAETPLALGSTPLLAIDLWEHAYYLDYQAHRDRYLEAVCDRLLDWDFAARQLARAR
jgi:superoxide dismutase, Fe-Mn family